MSTAACTRAREAAPEVALGVVDGETRAEVLAHVETCPGCRAWVGDLAGTVDALALVAPAADPPAGFEARVLAAIAEGAAAERSPRPPRWRRFRRTAAVVAATAAAASVVSVALVRIVDRDRAPEAPPAASAGWVPMVGAGGQVAGRALATGGDPAWVVVHVDYAVPDGRYRVAAGTASAAGTETLGTVELVEGRGTWAGPALAGADVRSVELVDGDGTVVCRARFDGGPGGGPAPTWGDATGS